MRSTVRTLGTLTGKIRRGYPGSATVEAPEADRVAPALAATTEGDRGDLAQRQLLPEDEQPGDRRDAGLEAHEDAEDVARQAAQRLDLERVRDDARQQRDAEAEREELRLDEVGSRLRDPGPERDERGDDHRERQALHALEAGPGALRDEDVGRPEGAGDERQADADEVGVAAGPGEEHDADRGEQRPQQVQAAARAEHRHGERPGELRGDRDAERDPVERLVEREVHAAEHEAVQPGELEVRARVAARIGADDREEDDRREAEAQRRRPRRAEVVEQRRGERGAELQGDDRAEDEPERRNPVDPALHYGLIFRPVANSQVDQAMQTAARPPVTARARPTGTSLVPRKPYRTACTR
jgi:hypothetical protein